MQGCLVLFYKRLLFKEDEDSMSQAVETCDPGAESVRFGEMCAEQVTRVSGLNPSCEYCETLGKFRLDSS